MKKNNKTALTSMIERSIIKKTLVRIGVFYEYADEFMNDNRYFTVVIDERQAGVKFEDAITMRMSAKTLLSLANKIVDGDCGDFVAILVNAVNNHPEDLKMVDGEKFWTAVINRFEYVCHSFGIHFQHFTKLDLARMYKHFGYRGFQRLMIDVVLDDFGIIPKCYVCRHCHCNSGLQRRCNCVAVAIHDDAPVRVDFRDIETNADMTHNLEYICDALRDEKRECPMFERRDTGVVDWAVRFRNAHFK